MFELLRGGDRSHKLDRGDRLVMWALTAIYTVFTLLNLGNIAYPKQVWTSVPGESFSVDLGREQDVLEIWINGNIAQGRLQIYDERGGFYEYEQVFGDMFSWRKRSVDLHGRYLTLTVYSGDISLNEIAFFDAQGQRIDAQVLTPAGSQANLLDEQQLVPDEPTYMNGMYFDEIYHARTAYEFIHGMSVYEWTHPPLGKILIAVGVLIFGMSPFGWRVVPALFGAGMLPLMFLLGKRLFRRRDLAFLSSALFAVDTMHFAQTRIATVDVFVVFFILLMFLFMADFLREDFLKAPMKRLLKALGACGVSFGLGVAAKWTGLYAGAGLAVLFFGHLIRVWLDVRRSKTGKREFEDRCWSVILFCVGAFLLVPAAIYYLSYIPFYNHERLQGRPVSFMDNVRLIINQQKGMYDYHSKLKDNHLCQSAWYEWPFNSKSVWFYISTQNNKVSNISTFGNPAVWWISAVGALCLIVEAAFGRLRKTAPALRLAAVVIGVGVAANLLPWTLVTRCIFAYHYFPTLPFVILAGVLMVQHLEETREFPGWVKWAWLGFAAVYFLLLLPAASGLPTSRAYAVFLERVLPSPYIYYGSV